MSYLFTTYPNAQTHTGRRLERRERNAWRYELVGEDEVAIYKSGMNGKGSSERDT